MDIDQYIKGLQNVIKQISQPKRFMNAVIVPPASKFLGTLKIRIQKEGLNSDGRKIGNYSTEPIYVAKDKFVKKSAFKPSKQGYETTSQRVIRDKKTGKVKGGKVTKKYQTRKLDTMYLNYGYKQLRDIQGMPTDKVDLTYSTSMMQNYQMGVKAENREVAIGFTSELEYLKSTGNEKHFASKIFTGTKDEFAQYKKEVFDRYSAYVSQYLKGQYGSGNISTD